MRKASPPKPAAWLTFFACVWWRAAAQVAGLANKALAEAYGTTVENIVGVSESTFQGPKEELDHFVADDRAVMSSGTLKFIPMETFTDITGKAQILETTKIPFTASATGERAVLGIAVDITARKQAEHRLQLTLAELDHRVKNTLALVQAVAEQAATKTDSVDWGAKARPGTKPPGSTRRRKRKNCRTAERSLVTLTKSRWTKSSRAEYR